MKIIRNIYNRLEEYLLILSLVFTVIIILLQVIMRNFGYSLSWSEELGRYIFIWQIWLGASLATRENQHIRVVILFNIFNGKFEKYFKLISNIVWATFCIFLAYNASEYCFNIYKLNSLSPAMRIPLYFVYSATPVGVGIMSLRLIANIITEIKQLFHTPRTSIIERTE